MSGLALITDNRASTQFLNAIVPRRDLRTGSVSDGRFLINYPNSNKISGTVASASQESKHFDSLSPITLRSLKSATIPETVGGNFHREIKAPLVEATKRQTMSHVVPNFIAYLHSLESTTITRIIDENPSRKIEILSPELTERRIMAQELLQYQELSANWDGDNGHAPSLSDIENALAFMDHIPDEGIISAESMVAGDGDVGFYWRGDNFYLEIGFQDGNISFYGKTSEGEKIGGDERFDGVSVPEKLDYWMKFIFSG